MDFAPHSRRFLRARAHGRTFVADISTDSASARGCGRSGAAVVAGCGCAAAANDGTVGYLTADGMIVEEREYEVPDVGYEIPGAGFYRSTDQWATPHGNYARKSAGEA